MNKLELKLQYLLNKADIQINGTREHDIQIYHPDFYKRVIGGGTLGLGESYMDGWWSCERLDLFFSKVLEKELVNSITTLRDKAFFASAHLQNRQTHKRARQVAVQHYDIGNDLYKVMLDENMIYTCGYWQDALNLNEAQEHKLELVCRKLKLEPGMKVLDIGCGWGGAARYMAQKYNVHVTGISNSKEQIELATTLSDESLSFELCDYRDHLGSYDRIYSLGMFEHVGFKNYKTFFDMVDRCLKGQGLFLLHTIGHRRTFNKVDPWISQYIFPNSILPSAELIAKHSAPTLNIEDWHNFGKDYYRTLMAWNNNIVASWPQLPHYDARFQRMWHYYLMSCAGTFKASRNHLWQIMFSKGILSSPYQAVRSALD